MSAIIKCWWNFSHTCIHFTHIYQFPLSKLNLILHPNLDKYSTEERKAMDRAVALHFPNKPKKPFSGAGLPLLNEEEQCAAEKADCTLKTGALFEFCWECDEHCTLNTSFFKLLGVAY